MRKQKRPDWPQRVYQFRAYPHQLPDQLWTTAKQMQTLWNTLIDLRETIKTLTKDLSKVEAKPQWKQFDDTMLGIAKQSPLNWEARQAVMDRFQTASRRAFKKGATLHKQGRLDKIMIPHRFTGGGMSLQHFFHQPMRAQRIRIAPIASQIYTLPYRQRRKADLTQGVFGLDGASTISFTCHLHRPIPAGSIIKQALWVGKFNRYRKQPWTWHVQLVVEEPPIQHERTDTVMMGLDLGWRIMGEGDYLRIGFLADSEGRTLELRLPMLKTDTRKIRHLLQHECPISTIYDLWDWEARISNAVETCKEQLRERLDPIPLGFVQMRQGGLEKLLREETCPPAVQTILQDWEEVNTKWRQIQTRVTDRLVGRKRWLYRNLASWLTKTYRTICWEGDFSVKKLAQSEDTPILQNAAKFRQWAALGELRLYLKQAAAKNGCTLIDAPQAFSTLADHETGELAQSSPALLIEYPGGIVRDQDFNSAMNLLNFGFSQMSSVFEQNGAQEREKPLIIPDVLQAVAVPCSPE